MKLWANRYRPPDERQAFILTYDGGKLFAKPMLGLDQDCEDIIAVVAANFFFRSSESLDQRAWHLVLECVLPAPLRRPALAHYCIGQNVQRLGNVRPFCSMFT